MSQSLKAFLITFFLSLIIFGSIAFFVTDFAEDAIVGDNNENIISSPVSGDNIGENKEFKGKSFNFLLLGSDYQPDVLSDYAADGEKKDFITYRKPSTDTIVIGRFDKERKTVLLSSLPSKMNVNIGGVSTTLGTVYHEKGIEYFMNAVLSLTGLRIDYYAVVDFTGFESLIDGLGGIEFEIPYNMSYADPEQNLDINITQGKKTLNGKDALKALRYNSSINSDKDRCKLTCDFVKALAEKLTKSSNLVNAESIYNKYSAYVTTNFTLTPLLENIDLVFSYPDYSVKIVEYPGSYSEDYSYFTPDVSAGTSVFFDYRQITE